MMKRIHHYVNPEQTRCGRSAHAHFSRLARRIMHEEFRNALVNAALPTLSPACCNMNWNCKRKHMELYLDTANVAEVERLARIFPLPG